MLASLRDQGLVLGHRGPHAAAFELNLDHLLASPLVALFDHERRSHDELVSLLREELRRHAAMVHATYLFGSAARPRVLTQHSAAARTDRVVAARLASEAALHRIGPLPWAATTVNRANV